MNKRRIFLAGLLAGFAVFVWGILSHVVIGIGAMAVKTMPNENIVLETLQTNLKEPGFYIYPGGMEEIESASKEQRDTLMKQYEEIYKTRPHGILVFTPPTRTFYSFPKLLVNELLSNVAGGLLAAWMLSHAMVSLNSFIRRVVFVACIGLFATLAIDVSYWNWYDFPEKYLISSFIDNTLGWTLADTVLARVLNPRT